MEKKESRARRIFALICFGGVFTIIGMLIGGYFIGWVAPSFAPIATVKSPPVRDPPDFTTNTAVEEPSQMSIVGLDEIELTLSAGGKASYRIMPNVSVPNCVASVGLYDLQGESLIYTFNNSPFDARTGVSAIDLTFGPEISPVEKSLGYSEMLEDGFDGQTVFNDENSPYFRETVRVLTDHNADDFAFGAYYYKPNDEGVVEIANHTRHVRSEASLTGSSGFDFSVYEISSFRRRMATPLVLGSNPEVAPVWEVWAYNDVTVDWLNAGMNYSEDDDRTLEMLFEFDGQNLEPSIHEWILVLSWQKPCIGRWQIPMTIEITE